MFGVTDKKASHEPLNGVLDAPTAETRYRMQRTRKRDTACEISLRKELYRLGLRYRVEVAPMSGLRQRADILFRKAKIAVFVDGCFWHKCTLHGTLPRANQTWWSAKLDANVERDTRNRAMLEGAGWSVIRVWEHEDPIEAAALIAHIVATQLGQP